MKKLSLAKLEKHRLSARQMAGAFGGGDTSCRHCTCGCGCGCYPAADAVNDESQHMETIAYTNQEFDANSGVVSG